MAMKTTKRTATAKSQTVKPNVAAILRDLKRNGSKRYWAEMSRHAIVTRPSYGVPLVKLRAMAKMIAAITI